MNSSRLNNIIFLIILFSLLIFNVPLEGQEKLIKVDNTAKYVSAGRYDWTVFILADDDILDSIEYVEYTLHPTFPNPVQRIYNRNSNFALSARGWGEFNILGKIVFKDGRTTTFQHWLKLEARSKEDIAIKTDMIKKSLIDEHGKIAAENTSVKIEKSTWEWTVFLVADDKTLNEVECVEYILHPTFPNPIQRVCDKGTASGKGFFLKAQGWGTFTIKIKVIFKDENVRNIEHKLVFSEEKEKGKKK